MRFKALILTAVFVAGFATIAMAGTPGINKRQAAQRARIAQGVHSGALTRAETARLMARQARIQHMEWRAKSDGVVTRRERVRLHRALDRESRAIYRKKHNARTRY